jgi:hypothetical protein
MDRNTDGTFTTETKIGAATRFKKGQTGNAAGRPREYGLTALLHDAIQEQDKDGVTIAQKLIDVAIDKALCGDFRYFREVMDRIEGKVTDKLELSTEQEYSEQEIHEAALLIMEGDKDEKISG